MGREEMFKSIPVKNPEVSWETGKSGRVKLNVERKEFIYKVIKVFTGKGRYEKVPLDRYGSFIWKNIDGKKSVQKILELLEDEYEGEIEDGRERTYKYFKSLKEYEFIMLINQELDNKK